MDIKRLANIPITPEQQQWRWRPVVHSNECGDTYCCCGDCPVPSGSVVTFASPAWLAAHPDVRYEPPS